MSNSLFPGIWTTGNISLGFFPIELVIRVPLAHTWPQADFCARAEPHTLPWWKDVFHSSIIQVKSAFLPSFLIHFSLITLISLLLPSHPLPLLNPSKDKTGKMPVYSAFLSAVHHRGSVLSFSLRITTWLPSLVMSAHPPLCQRQPEGFSF